MVARVEEEKRPFSAPSAEVISMLKFLWSEHEYQLPLIIGGVTELDQRLKYLIMHRDEKIAEEGIKALGMAISMSPAARTIMTFMLKAFPDAMRNLNIHLQQPITVKRPVQAGDDLDTR